MTLPEIRQLIYETVDSAPRICGCYLLSSEVLDDLIESAFLAGRNQELDALGTRIDVILGNDVARIVT